MGLPYGSLKTTVVGSFPLEHSVENMRRALSDQIEAGIDFPCYGQLLGMNEMFMEPLAREKCGIEMKKGEAWVAGSLRVPDNPITLEFLEFAKNYIEETPNVKIDGIRTPITGPITLASAARISEKHRAVEYPDFIQRFSEIVTKIVKWHDEAGAGIISLDEPSLSYALKLGIEHDVIIKAIDKPLQAVKKALTSVHVCGDISTTAKILIQSKAPILDHSFKDFPANFCVYSKDVLEKADKMIGLGCVSSNPDPKLLIGIRDGKEQWIEAVEPVAEVEKVILEGGRKFGLERLIIEPDCGFGGLKRFFRDDTGQKIATQKLKNVVVAVNRIKENLK